MNQTIGEVKCRFHRRAMKAELRRDKNGKLYYYCRACGGPVICHGRPFQEWLLNNARVYRAEELTA